MSEDERRALKQRGGRRTRGSAKEGDTSRGQAPRNAAPAPASSPNITPAMRRLLTEALTDPLHRVMTGSSLTRSALVTAGLAVRREGIPTTAEGRVHGRTYLTKLGECYAAEYAPSDGNAAAER